MPQPTKAEIKGRAVETRVAVELLAWPGKTELQKLQEESWKALMFTISPSPVVLSIARPALFATIVLKP